MRLTENIFSFVRDAGAMSFATMIAYGIALAGLPILARIYGPEAFGIFAIFLAVSAFVRFFFTFFSEEILVLPKADADAAGLGRALIFVCGLLGSATAFLGMSAAALGVGERIGLNSTIILLIGPAAGLLSLAGILRMSAVRAQMFRVIGTSIVLRALAALAFALIYGVSMPAGNTSLAAIGLCLSQMAGDFFACAVLGVSQRKLFDLRPAKWWNAASRTVRAHKHVVGAVATAQAFANAYSPIAVFALTTIAGIETVGWYSMAVRIIALPSSLLAQAISNVFRQRAAAMQASGQSIASLILNVRSAAAAIAFVPYAAIAIAGPALFVIFLGSEWRAAGEFAAILSVAGFLSFIAGVTDRASLILNRAKYIVVWHGLRLVTESVAALSLIAGILSVMEYIVEITILRSLIYVVELVYIHRAARQF